MYLAFNLQWFMMVGGVLGLVANTFAVLGAWNRVAIQHFFLWLEF